MTRTALFDAIRPFAPEDRFTNGQVQAIDALADSFKLARLAPVPRTLSDTALFFAAVRKVTGKLDDEQVRIINAMLTAASGWSTAWLAYGLATAWHEARLRPIEEIGRGKGLRYGAPGRRGQIAYGRGLVQLTWDWNYARADKELGLNGALIADYAKALEPDLAVAILVRGMEGGWFSGKSLADYLPAERGDVDQFKNARRLINGTDRDTLIAGYALSFQQALTFGGWA